MVAPTFAEKFRSAVNAAGYPTTRSAGTTQELAFNEPDHHFNARL